MKNYFFKVLSITLCLLGVTSTLSAQGYTPTQENIASREDFRNGRFGIFIHWGIYSMMADGEWIMNNLGLNYKEYAKLAEGFYPSKFDAAQWVSAIKASGATYICITSRHHDGFSMFHTRQSGYNIVDATPFGRDIIKELADECHKQGIRLHFYYSHLDWQREDYPWNTGRTGAKAGRPAENINWDSYYQFMNNQLSELLTNYGEIGAIWFDGAWDQWEKDPSFDWGLEQQYALIHSIQPACLVGNNHHRNLIDGEDIQLFEKDLPGQNVTGFSRNMEISTAVPLETCETMNGMWGYKMRDTDYKSVKVLIDYIVNAAGRDANLLMNIGPQPNGELPAAALERLSELGEWMQTYGPTIYGTRGGAIEPHTWGATTQKDNVMYVHVLNLTDNALYLPIGDKKVKKATCFVNGETVKYQTCQGGILLNMENVLTDEPDRVIQLTF